MEKRWARLEGASLGQVRAGAWVGGDGEGMVGMGGIGTFWQVELCDRNCKSLACHRGGGEGVWGGLAWELPGMPVRPRGQAQQLGPDFPDYREAHRAWKAERIRPSAQSVPP